MAGTRAIAATLLAALLFGAAAPALAHDSRPLFVEITETADRLLRVRAVVPPTVPAFNHPALRLDAPCQAVAGQSLYRCPADGAPVRLTIGYPVFNPALTTLVRMTRADGQSITVTAGPAQAAVDLPGRMTWREVAGSYFRLGVEHILAGYDHLLFLICLIVIAGTLRRVLITVTGFTLAHSVTLGLSALEVVRLPVPPVEAGIALSIAFVAGEIARGRSDTLTRCYPIAVSSLFGLLHGFGFASALREVGLPQDAVISALLFFNLGVEAGQVFFVSVVMAAFALMLRFARRTSAPPGFERAGFERAGFERAIAYTAGPLAAFWAISRSGLF